MQDGYVRRVRVISNYDGDTIRADIDLGFGQWSHNQTFRLYGINTPELRGGTAETKQAGRDAKDRDGANSLASKHRCSSWLYAE